MSSDVERSEDFVKIHAQYKDGNRAKIQKCVEVLNRSKDKDSFMRSFMLLALGTVYCPTTGYLVNLKYLPCLMETSKIKDYDWAGHIIEEIMLEVKKCQGFSPTRPEEYHCMSSCLAVLVVCAV